MRDLKPRPKAEKKSAGGTLVGIFVGLLIGVLAALGVAWYMAKMPMPFQSKGGKPEEAKAPAGQPTAGTPAPAATPAATPPAAPAQAAAAPAATPQAAPTAPATPAAAPAAKGPDPIALPGKPGDKAGEKPRFEFYKILPNGEAANGDAKPAEAQKAADGQKTAEGQKPAAPPKPANETSYLQVGAFTDPADADNLKAKLALMGFEAKVQQINVPEKGVLHRVRIGPFAKSDEANATRSQLSANGIQASLIKGK